MAMNGQPAYCTMNVALPDEVPRAPQQNFMGRRASSARDSEACRRRGHFLAAARLPTRFCSSLGLGDPCVHTMRLSMLAPATPPRHGVELSVQIETESPAKRPGVIRFFSSTIEPPAADCTARHCTSRLHLAAIHLSTVTTTTSGVSTPALWSLPGRRHIKVFMAATRLCVLVLFAFDSCHSWPVLLPGALLPVRAPRV